MPKYPRATDELFTDSRFNTAHDKCLTVNSVVRFLESGLAPDKLTKRAYTFFQLHLSMPAEYNIDGFRWRHLKDATSKSRFLREVRDRVDRHAMLDPDRRSDMAVLFADPGAFPESRYHELLVHH